MVRSNLHAHTSYCDGQNSCEEMLLAAMDKGLKVFGISEHSHTSVPGDTGNLTAETMLQFFAEMRELSDKYADRITVFTGIEQDACWDLPADGADYIIGSTHFVFPGGVPRYVDGGAEYQIETVSRYYSGDWYAFAEEYFCAEASVAKITNCDIVGHFDLVNKNNEGDSLFDTSHARYRTAAIDSMLEILKTHSLFEVNTGAMYRAGRSEQYPQTWLLEELLRRGGEVIISSDAHDTQSIDFRFSETEELLRRVGFKYRKILTPEGFVNIDL